MRRRTTLLAWARSLTLLAGVGVPCLAQAADLLPPPPPPPVPLPPVEVGGGWYLRGDAGASFYDKPAYSSIDHPPAVYYGGKAETGWFAGAGIGYEFNGFLRGDITGEYRKTGLRTSSYSDFAFSACDVGVGCYYQQGRTTNDSAGHYEGAVFLANAYFDLGHFYGVTPFVGGGVGVAFNHLNGFTDTGSTVTQTTFESGHVVNGGGTSSGTFKDKSKTNFAWALHAGFAMSVSHNMKLELAYRYINLGSASTGVLNCLCGQVFTPIKVKDLEAHEVKVGLRYLLGGAVAAAPEYYPPPAPLMRKY